MTPSTVQAFPEYILQGKHFAHSVGKPIFADEEVSALDMLYGHTSHPQSMDHFMKKVCLKVPSTHLSCTYVAVPPASLSQLLHWLTCESAIPTAPPAPQAYVSYSQ